MIIDVKSKGFEQNPLFPNVNWYGDDRVVVDETKEENQELIQKIKVHAPYIDLVIENGQIIDVIPVERPEKIVTEVVDEEKAFLAEGVIQLSNELETLKQEIKTLKGGN